MRRMEKVETKFAFDFRAFARIRSFLFVFDRTISAAVFFDGLKKITKLSVLYTVYFLIKDWIRIWRMIGKLVERKLLTTFFVGWNRTMSIMVN